MAQSKLRFFFREPTIDTNRPLTEGTVRVEGFDLELVGREQEADAWDCGFAARVRNHVEGRPYLSIPAFPNRKFRLSSIYVNSAAGIESPRDLEGKRMGIIGWYNTAGVWARGALQHEYGVDLTRIRWLTTRLDTTDPAPRIHVKALPQGADLDSFLVQGEVDAAIDPNVLPSISRRDPRVRRLFRDYKSEEQVYFKRTGIFPISHVVTLKRQFVERYPEAPVTLLRAFRKARDIAFERLGGPDPEIVVISWAVALLEEQRALMGENYWPYNLEDNLKVLATLTQYAHEQGLSPQRIDYESLFAPEAARLPGA